MFRELDLLPTRMSSSGLHIHKLADVDGGWLAGASFRNERCSLASVMAHFKLGIL